MPGVGAAGCDMCDGGHWRMSDVTEESEVKIVVVRSNEHKPPPALSISALLRANHESFLSHVTWQSTYGKIIALG